MRRLLVLAVVGVQRLARELMLAAVEELHDERVAAVVVGGEEREAALDEDALVDDEVGQLGGRHHGALDHRPPPHERHLRGLALLAAPGADDVVGEVDLPVRVALGGVGGEVGLGVEVRRLLAVAARRVADVAEELVAVRGGDGRGHERPPVPRAVGVPDDVAGLAELLALGVDAQALREELLLQALGPAAVGQQVLGRLGGEAGDDAVFGRHGANRSAAGRGYAPRVLPDGVHRLELPTPFAVGPVSTYVLAGEPLTLVDPGPLRDKTRAALEEGLRALGRRVEDVELVVLTHQHHDHVGLAAEVARRSGARVAATPKLASFLGDYERWAERDDAYALATMARHGIDGDARQTLDDISRSFRRYSEGVAVDVVVGDGEALVAGGRTFTAYERPGHSPTDTVFLDAADGLLIGGDHLLERVSSNPIAHVPIDDRDPVAVARTDRRRALVEYLASMRASAEPGAAPGPPGHRPPVAGHRALIATREEMHARRARRILREIDGTRTAADMIGVLWRAPPPPPADPAPPRAARPPHPPERGGALGGGGRGGRGVGWRPRRGARAAA